MASKMLQQYLAAEHLVDRLKGSAARSAAAHNPRHAAEIPKSTLMPESGPYIFNQAGGRDRPGRRLHEI
jgi:hypothetical protein